MLGFTNEHFICTCLDKKEKDAEGSGQQEILVTTTGRALAYWDLPVIFQTVIIVKMLSAGREGLLAQHAVCVVARSEDNRRCLNGGGETSSRRHDPYRVRFVDFRTRRPAAVPGIAASEVRHHASRSNERLRVCCL